MGMPMDLVSLHSPVRPSRKICKLLLRKIDKVVTKVVGSTNLLRGGSGTRLVFTITVGCMIPHERVHPVHATLKGQTIEVH